MVHCNLCGRQVGENEYQVLHRRNRSNGKGLTVCADCLRARPRCIVCQLPMREDRRSLGVCPDCLREGINCRTCGRPITGDWIILNSNDGPYCRDCFNGRAACALCGAPVGAAPRQLPDGRPLCDPCFGTRVTDPLESQVLFDRVLDLLDNKMGMRLNIRPTLMLVDHARLVELARAAVPEQEKRRDKTLALFARNGRHRTIYLQDQLPRIIFIQVVAHEFAHAWQGENAPLLSSLILQEGLAEWTAYHILLELDARKKADQMLARADFYGDGLRQLLTVEQRVGPVGVLDFVRSVRNNGQFGMIRTKETN